MPNPSTHKPETGSEKLLSLRNFKGAPEQFWPNFLDSVLEISGAEGASVQISKDNAPRFNLCQKGQAIAKGFEQKIPGWHSDGANLILISLLPVKEDLECRLLLSVPKKNREMTQTLLPFILEVPVAYEQGHQLSHSPEGSKQLSHALALLASIENEKHFPQVLQKLCGEIAAYYQADRVCAGWLKGPYLRLLAISDSPDPDRKMEANQALEAMMEEALDLDEEILWPNDGFEHRYRVHQHWAKHNEGTHLLSLPIRLNEETLGVLNLQRTKAFSRTELMGLRVALDRSSPALKKIQLDSRPLPLRCWHAGEEGVKRLFGPKNSLTKAVLLLFSFTLFLSMVIPVPYRVEAPFILRSDKQAVVSSPFQGYIAEVYSEVGQKVEKGQLLLKLDQTEWRLKQEALKADLARHESEARKQRGSARAAEMKIAEAQALQTHAELKVVESKLERSELRAPIGGILVEGRHQERIGAVTREGDPLFRLAQLKPLHLEMEIDERRLQDLEGVEKGEISFTTRPDLSFPFSFRHVEPAARSEGGKHVFVAVGDPLEVDENWWRPGMTGLAKVDAGERSLFSIFTRDLLDWMRLQLWW